MNGGDPFKPVQSGDPLEVPAATYNLMLEAALAYRRGLLGQGGSRRAGTARQTGIVLIKNASGAARSRFDVLAISGPLADPAADLDTFCERAVLTGELPAAAHTGRFAILLNAADDGEIVPAVVSGVTICRVDVVDADHRFADVKAGDATQLASGLRGAATILYVQAGTGTKWAVVRIGSPAVPAEAVFAVLVWRDGGTTDGDESTQCDRTYTAKTLDGQITLGTALTPKRVRPTTGTLVTPPTTGDGVVGLGYFEADGDFVLFDANEALDTDACD